MQPMLAPMPPCARGRCADRWAKSYRWQGSNAEIRATREFPVAHQLRPMVELYPLKEMSVALERLRQNHMRYRAVLVNQG